MKIKNATQAKSSNSKKVILAIIIALVVIAGGAFAYATYRSQQPNELPDTTTDQENQNVPPSDATQEQIDAGNTIKEGSVDQNNGSGANTMNVSLVAYKKDASMVHVDVSIAEILSNGTCSITVTNGSSTKTATADTYPLAQYTTCKGFDLPVAELNSGTWNIKVTVTSGDRSGSADTKLEV